MFQEGATGIGGGEEEESQYERNMPTKANLEITDYSFPGPIIAALAEKTMGRDIRRAHTSLCTCYNNRV
jgi:hypothetical protein